jgi:hypothetical protein
MLPKSARLLLLAAVLASANAHGAPKAEGSAATAAAACAGGRITTAGDVAAFAGCRAIRGDLSIERTDLSDLSALSELRSVSGALTIRDNTNLRDLGGLERLERVGSLVLLANGLYGTGGIEGLRRAGSIVVAGNPLLISLKGFKNLSHVDTLVVSRNPRVCARLGLFPALTSVKQRLTVTSNLGLSRGEVESLFARTRGDERPR